MSTTAGVDFLYSLMKSGVWPGERPRSGGPTAATLFDGWPTFRLHGNIPQNERLATYKAFRDSKQGLLICSDVAARGVDIPHVDWVLQFDPPADISDYVHRIGRTARSGSAGCSLLFVSPNEAPLLDALSGHGLKIAALSLEKNFERAFGGSSKAVTAFSLHDALEGAVSGSPELLELASKAFKSFVRAYSAHTGELKHIFQTRALHLGHVARSFALANAPSVVGGSESRGDRYFFYWNFQPNP